MVADSSNTAKRVSHPQPVVVMKRLLRSHLVLQALTIAVRYAAVRRQFASGKNKLETQLLDYPIHQRRLMVSILGCDGPEA